MTKSMANDTVKQAEQFANLALLAVGPEPDDYDPAQVPKMVARATAWAECWTTGTIVPAQVNDLVKQA